MDGGRLALSQAHRSRESVPRGCEAGYTVADLAVRYRVGEDKVRKWIVSGEIDAVNTASVLCGRPRYVVTAESLEQFERRRKVATPAPKAQRRRRNVVVDYYPGLSIICDSTTYLKMLRTP